jgi:hypothetical protein
MEFAREEHPIAVEWEECILQLMECLEVECIGYSDCWPMIPITPSNIVSIFDEDYTRIIAIDPFSDLLVITLKAQRLMVDIPVDSIIAEANM